MASRGAPVGQRLAAFAVLLSLASAASCSSSDDSSAGGFGGFAGNGGCFGVSCSTGGAGGKDGSIDVASGGTGGDASGTSPLCGTGNCSPDDPTSCVDYDAGPGADAGSDASGGQDAGLDGDAAFYRREASEQAGYTDATASGPNADTGNDRDGSAIPAEDTPPFGCRVGVENGQRLAECAPAGTGLTGAPCVSSADCAARYACVGDGSAAQCRRFCCGGTGQCAVGQHCVERATRNGADAEASLGVPVCVAADDCSLSEPYPCPPGNACTCPAGSACTVVRDDGTTSCLPPGTGVEGNRCPCAWNHICSQATSRCVKLCSTTSVQPDCGSGKCQSAANLPDGWGVCVGASDAGH